MQEFTKKTRSEIERAKEEIKAGRICIALIRDEQTIYTTQGRGVKPLLDLLDHEPSLLKESIIVDKIVGRAAAFLMILGGAKSVYALTMSLGAQAEFKKAGIKNNAEALTDVIVNRTGDGSCPMEKAVQDISDPQEAPVVLKEAIAELRSSLKR